jgi:hypothetical protein
VKNSPTDKASLERNPWSPVSEQTTHTLKCSSLVLSMNLPSLSVDPINTQEMIHDLNCAGAEEWARAGSI